MTMSLETRTDPRPAETSAGPSGDAAATAPAIAIALAYRALHDRQDALRPRVEACRAVMDESSEIAIGLDRAFRAYGALTGREPRTGSAAGDRLEAELLDLALKTGQR